MVTWRLPWDDGTGNCSRLVGVSSAHFFSSTDESRGGAATYRAIRRNALAKEICVGCPLFVPCGEHGILHEEHGLWGGMTASDLAAERKSRGIQIRHSGSSLGAWLKSSTSGNRSEEDE